MIARPDDAAPPDPALDVVRVTDRAMVEDFLTAYIAGRAIPDGEQFRHNVRPWIDQEGWSLFLGRLNGTPDPRTKIAYVRIEYAGGETGTSNFSCGSPKPLGNVTNDP